MKKIQIKKVKRHQLQILQNELIHYTDHLQHNDLKIDFLNAITAIDINTSLYYLLRNRIEKHSEKFNLNFSISQAATVMKCCNYNRSERDPLDVATLVLIGNSIDQQLKSIN